MAKRKKKRPTLEVNIAGRSGLVDPNGDPLGALPEDAWKELVNINDQPGEYDFSDLMMRESVWNVPEAGPPRDTTDAFKGLLERLDKVIAEQQLDVTFYRTQPSPKPKPKPAYAAGGFVMTSQQAMQMAQYYVDALGNLNVRVAANPIALPEPKRLEVEQQDMPILAHRSALLFVDEHGPFGSVAIGGRFGVDAMARCAGGSYASYGRHEAPYADCECGFYALPPDKPPTYPESQYVTLQVELYGRVIVCQRGYRAQFQRVIECQIPVCAYCRRQSQVVHTFDGRMAAATCGADDCADYAQPFLCGCESCVSSQRRMKSRVIPVDELDLPVATTRQGTP